MLTNKNLYFFILVLCVIIICMLGILIYVIINKRHEIPQATEVPKHKRIQINSKIINTKEDIPVYPKNMPQYENNEYQQIGILTTNEMDKEPIVLPLFAKKVRNNKERWQYYTATDKNNMMRLPIVHHNMKCDEDIGCKEIYDGDKLSVGIYQGRVFTATIYKTDAPKYFADNY
jgi:hypothetical protein